MRSSGEYRAPPAAAEGLTVHDVLLNGALNWVESTLDHWFHIPRLNCTLAR